MSVQNLHTYRYIGLKANGSPNSSGTVGVYTAGSAFGTFATIWDTSTKDATLTNPVTLDSDGTKEIWFDVKVDIQEKDSSGNVVDQSLAINPNLASATVNAGILVNGSFETDTDTDGQPDDWTIGAYSGSAIAISSTVVTNGDNSLEFNTAGAATGGGLATSAKFPVTEGTDVNVAWSFYATNATTTNTFQIKWYNEADALQSTSTLNMPASGSVPTSWTNYTEVVAADAAATKGEVVLTGIDSGGANLTSKAYFDGIVIDNNPSFVSFTIETAISVSSATESFTSIPSWVKKITVSFDVVSASATASIVAQLGDPTLETTNYDSIVSVVRTANNNTCSASTTAFQLGVSLLAGGTLSGVAILTLLDPSTNTWAYTSNMGDSTVPEGHYGSGSKSLSGTLSVLTFGVSAGTFDAGKINILYEG